MFGREVAEVYDLLYRGRGKDFQAEAMAVARLVRQRKPAAASLLDVACGTGEHLVSLRHAFARVEGVELSPDMWAVATAKLPTVPICRADMRTFDLGRVFDAVCCLFSSIAYMRTVPELEAAVACMARHLAPGGVLLLEPWWFPERFLDGHVAGHVVRTGGRSVARVSRSVRAGDATRMESHYLAADATGVKHFSQVELLTLFSLGDYLTAVERAGCTAEFLPEEQSGRGLVLGVLRPGPSR